MRSITSLRMTVHLPVHAQHCMSFGLRGSGRIAGRPRGLRFQGVQAVCILSSTEYRMVG